MHLTDMQDKSGVLVDTVFVDVAHGEDLTVKNISDDSNK
jgi:hypothetical protein